MTIAVALLFVLVVSVVPCFRWWESIDTFGSFDTKQGWVPATNGGMWWTWSVEQTLGRTVVNAQLGGARLDWSNGVPGDVPAWSVVLEESTPSKLPASNGSVFQEEAFGWPRRALMSRCRWPIASQNGDPVIICGVKNTQFQKGVAALIWPTRILWSGFLVDWLAMIPFAAATVFFPTGVRGFSRSLRREYELCGACGYTRLGRSLKWTCPECGSCERFVHPIGWTIRFSMKSFFNRPRVAMRLLLGFALAVFAAAIGVMLSRFV